MNFHMRLRALAFLVALGEAAVLAGLAVVCGALARDEDVDEHDCGGTCPAHDVGPDDLMDVAEAVGVLVAGMTQPLSWELAKTPVIRNMTLPNSAAWLATARDIDGLPVFRGGR